MIAIVKYNAGNVQSVRFALQRLGVESILTDDHEVIRTADRVIFPGVGEASTTMRFLRETKLDALLKSLTQPVLGICLGMQLMCQYSEENDTSCIGIFSEKVKKFESQTAKIPHMGWNSVNALKPGIISSDIDQGYVYFVHSYYVELGPDAIASTNYIKPFCSVINKDNFWATQFHPEKSGSVGEKILSNFLVL